MWRHGRIISTLLILVSTNALSASAAPEKGTAAVGKLVGAFSSWSGKEDSPFICNKASNFIDYTQMSERALGNSEWEKLGAAERNQFVAALRSLIEQRYYPRWHHIFSKATVDYVGELPSGSDILVKTSVKLGKKVDTVVWRLNGRGSDYKVISLAMGDRDLLNRLKARLQPKLEKSGFQGLLTWMQSKAKQQSTENEVSSTETVIGDASK